MTAITLRPGIEVAPQINEADVADAALRGVGTIVCNRPDGEDPGQPSAAEMTAMAERHGLRFVHAPVGPSGITPQAIGELRSALGSDAPLLAYCRTGFRSVLLHAFTRAADGEAGADLVAEAEAAGFDLAPWADALEATRPEAG